MKKKIIIVGCGGHALSVYELLSQNENYSILGYVNDKKENFYNLKYLGNDNFFVNNFSTDIFIALGVGQVQNLKLRENIFNFYKEKNFFFPVLKSYSSIVSVNSFINEGTIIMHNVIINSGVKIDKNCIINNNALIEHSSAIGANTHISTGSIINGDCKIGKNCFIGSNSTIDHGVVIENNTFIPSHTKVRKNEK